MGVRLQLDPFFLYRLNIFETLASMNEIIIFFSIFEFLNITQVFFYSQYSNLSYLNFLNNKFY